MADFQVIEGELVPIDVSGNPLPIQDAGSIGITPGVMVAAKDGALARFLEVSTVSGAKALKVDVVQSVTPGSPTTPSLVTFPEYSKTLFGDLKVASPLTLGDFNFKYEIEAREFGTSTATGGTVTHQANLGTARLAVTGANGSRARLKTHTYFRYQSGKVQWLKFTGFQADTGQTNQIRRWGPFDDNDGLFFQLSGTTLSVVRRSSTSGVVVDDPTLRSAWNKDKLDGTGASGVTLDLSKANIFEITYEWLGAGSVQFFVNGILAHQMSFPNTLAAPYMRTGQLPLQWEVVNTGASTASSMDVICCSALSMGGDKVPLTSFSFSSPTDKSVTTTEIPVLSIRPKATYNSFENRMLALPFLVAMRTEGVRLGWRIFMNATLTGASFTSVAANSGVEADTAATAFSGGEVLFQGFLANSNDQQILDLQEMFSVLGRKLRRDAFLSTTDILTITAITEAAGTSNVRSSLSWYEAR